MNNLQEKVAIITGGSGGIGSAVCLKLAQLGAKVVVHYGGSKDAAEDVVNKIETANGKAIALQADLSKITLKQNEDRDICAGMNYAFSEHVGLHDFIGDIAAASS